MPIGGVGLPPQLPERAPSFPSNLRFGYIRCRGPSPDDGERRIHATPEAAVEESGVALADQARALLKEISGTTASVHDGVQIRNQFLEGGAR
jgi:hypothetical protein